MFSYVQITYLNVTARLISDTSIVLIKFKQLCCERHFSYGPKQFIDVQSRYITDFLNFE